MNLKRILIASRGEMAKRLIQHYKAKNIETVVVFSEADAEQPYLDDADYAVYLNGMTVSETYMNPNRVVGAALDAGCDAIHPGYCFLAEHVGFYVQAVGANVAVYGADPTRIADVVDRVKVRSIASSLQIPLIPCSEPIPKEEDGLAAAVQLGFPLFVKAVSGGALALVECEQDLIDAVADVRQLARAVSGDASVFLERSIDEHRHIGVTIVADRHDNVVHLGPMDGSLEVRYHTWIEELGPEILPEIAEKIAEASVKLSRGLKWTGVGKVRWAVTPDGGWYLLGFSARLATGYSLVEAVHGVDLIDVQRMALEGEAIPWTQADAQMTRHGVQVRIHHVRTSDLSRPEGTITRLHFPEDVFCEVGVSEGLHCTLDSEPLVAKITVTAPTRQAALVRARAALDQVVVEGIETNLQVLKDMFDDEGFWRGDFGVRSLEMIRGD